MIAEFNRIREGELYNRRSGETRVNLYITLLSLTIAGLVGLWELAAPQDALAVRAFSFIALIALSFMSLVGMVTLRLLAERWRLTVLYLRKLARIRQWFADQDQSLHGNLVYSIDEESPSFVSEGFLSSSLVTLVSVLNSVSVAASAVSLLVVLAPSVSLLRVAVVGACVPIAVWVIQRRVVTQKLYRLEEDKYAAFPWDGKS
jgi:hypothetical protein